MFLRIGSRRQHEYIDIYKRWFICFFAQITNGLLIQFQNCRTKTMDFLWGTKHRLAMDILVDAEGLDATDLKLLLYSLNSLCRHKNRQFCIGNVGKTASVSICLLSLNQDIH